MILEDWCFVNLVEFDGSIIAPRKRKRSRNCTDCRSTSIPSHPCSTARGSVLPHRSRICNQMQSVNLRCFLFLFLENSLVLDQLSISLRSLAKNCKSFSRGGMGGEGGRWEFFFNSLNRGEIPEIIRLAYVPIFKSDRPAIGHPEESTFLGLVGTGGPKVLVSKAKILNVLLQSVVLLLRRYTRQMHPVISAILRRSVPIGLQRIK